MIYSTISTFSDGDGIRDEPMKNESSAYLVSRRLSLHSTVDLRQFMLDKGKVRNLVPPFSSTSSMMNSVMEQFATLRLVPSA